MLHYCLLIATSRNIPTPGDVSEGRVFEESTMDSTILATVLKRYLSSLIVPLIPADQHSTFLTILNSELVLNSFY